MSTKSRSENETEAWWALLTALLRSMRERPLAWLLAVWLSGWALFAWHVIHPASWDTVWGTVNKALLRAQGGHPGTDQVGVTWLHEVVRWGQVTLYISTGLLAFYVSYAMWVWWRYTHAWMPQMREERLRGGRVLEVLIPRGSKADTRAAADMLGQLWNLLSDMAGGARGGFDHGKMDAERLALSLEMWSTPDTGGKVGFYVWCPAAANERHGDPSGASNKERDHFIEEVRGLIKVYHPRSRVRWVDDPVKKALIELAQPAGTPGLGRKAGTEGAKAAAMVWYELGLLADSRFPIGSGASDERLLTGNRSTGRSGSPGAGSDALAAVISMLGTDNDVLVMGIQVVIAARPERSGQTQETVNKELARLRELEMQAGKRALGPQHEARVMALEEKADRQGFDAVIRLVAVEHVVASGPATRAEARLASLFRKYRQYDRSIAGLKQGFQVVRRERVDLNAAHGVASSPSTIPPGLLWRAGPVLGRWPSEGVCLPRLLPFMRTGKP